MRAGKKHFRRGVSLIYHPEHMRAIRVFTCNDADNFGLSQDAPHCIFGEKVFACCCLGN